MSGHPGHLSRGAALRCPVRVRWCLAVAAVMRPSRGGRSTRGARGRRPLAVLVVLLVVAVVAQHVQWAVAQDTASREAPPPPAPPSGDFRSLPQKMADAKFRVYNTTRFLKPIDQCYFNIRNPPDLAPEEAGRLYTRCSFSAQHQLNSTASLSYQCEVGKGSGTTGLGLQPATTGEKRRQPALTVKLATSTVQGPASRTASPSWS